MSGDPAFLDLLYSAPVSPELWVPVMERLADMAGGSGAWLSNLSVVDGSGQGLWARVDPGFPDLFFSHYAARNPLNNVPNVPGYMRAWSPCVITDEDWIAKDELRRTEFYNDFLTPLQATSVAMIRLAKDETSSATSVINIGRPAGRGGFSSQDIERLTSLQPHLIRAFRLTREVTRARALDLCTPAASTEPRRAAILIDARGAVVRASAAAEQMLRLQQGLKVVAGRLHPVEAQLSSALYELIRRACASPPGPRLGGYMALPSADRVTPLVLSIAPVMQEISGVFHNQPLGLVLISDPVARRRPPEALLIDMFDLTSSEARLANALLDGGAVRDVAERLGISANTASVHLARIFTKVGVNRQGELVALLSRIAAHVPDADL